jgi:ribonucleoside-triphosphate reductase
MAARIIDENDRWDWGPIGREVYERTYSRTKPDGKKENWLETVTRTVDGNLALVSKKFHWKDEREQLIKLMLAFKLLPAGRHLWVSGVPGRQFLFNCHTAGWTDYLPDHYTFTFDELMKGGGVGANYSNKHIRKYSAVKHALDLHFVCNPNHADYEKLKPLLSKDYHHDWAGCTRIDDSREGWVKALKTILDAAFYATESRTIVLDVSLIRAYGSLIRGFGGTASGPYALVEMLTKIARLLAMRVGHKLVSLDHMLMDHYIAECVVAGNVRRSARMSIKHWKDEDIFDFIHCKEDKDRVAHFTTNISVEIDNAFFRAYHRGDEWAKSVYKECIDGLYASGEPGFWNSSLSQVGEVDEVYCTNPCGEISMMPWENCNLGHVNLDAFYNDPEGAKLAFKLMARFLVRATFGDISNSLQREIVNRNRRIGVGFFGYQGWVCKQGIRYSESHRDYNIRSQLKDFYKAIKEEVQEYSHLLRIPCPIKLTTVAPTGTIAKLPGKTEGAQSLIAKWFVRRVRYANGDPRLAELIAKGFHAEPCVYTKDTTVISFWCKDRLVEEMEMLGMDTNLVEDQSEVDIEDALAVQAMLQREFVDNSISFTVNLPDEGIAKKKLYHTVLRFLPELKGTTIIRGAGDRPQAPYQRITREEFENYSGPRMTSQGEMECKGNACPVK